MDAQEFSHIIELFLLVTAVSLVLYHKHVNKWLDRECQNDK
jgi:hypothetical protein